MYSNKFVKFNNENLQNESHIFYPTRGPTPQEPEGLLKWGSNIFEK